MSDWGSWSLKKRPITTICGLSCLFFYTYEVRRCHCSGSRLAWKHARTSKVSPSTTKNSEYGNRRKGARRTFLNTTGKLPGIGAHAFGQDSNRFAETSA